MLGRCARLGAGVTSEATAAHALDTMLEGACELSVAMHSRAM